MDPKYTFIDSNGHDIPGSLSEIPPVRLPENSRLKYEEIFEDHEFGFLGSLGISFRRPRYETVRESVTGRAERWTNTNRQRFDYKVTVWGSSVEDVEAVRRDLLKKIGLKVSKVGPKSKK